MSGRWSLLAALLLTGCQGLPHKLGKTGRYGVPCAPGAGEPCADGAAGQPCGPGACPVPSHKPQVEVCREPCREQPEIQVNVPRQKIVLPRRGGRAGPASVAGGAVTERQQMVQTRQVVLMPQQVLVPFVQTTVSGPVRVAETQETTVVDVASTTTAAGAAVLATGQATTAGAAGTAGAGAAGAAGAAGVTPANLNECLAQLRLYEQRIAQYQQQIDKLAAQVEALKGCTPPRPK